MERGCLYLVSEEAGDGLCDTHCDEEEEDEGGVDDVTQHHPPGNHHVVSGHANTTPANLEKTEGEF